MGLLPSNFQRALKIIIIAELFIVMTMPGLTAMRKMLIHDRTFLKEDLVDNGYSLFAEELILKPQYAEEFMKSFQFRLVTIFSRF